MKVGNIDQWDSAAFKNVENDLLKMKNRRQEIPNEIQQRENTVKDIESKIKELEQEQEKLSAAVIEKQKQLDYFMQHPPKNASENEADNERLRNYWQNSVDNVRQAIESLENQRKIIYSEIRSSQSRIQILKTEVSQLKNEDKKILEDCRVHLQTQKEVETEAGRAINEHIKASKGFTQTQAATRFGSAAIASAKQNADKMVEKYNDKKNLSHSLAELALSIINGGNVSDQLSADEETGSSLDGSVMNKGYMEHNEMAENKASASTTVQQQKFLENYGTSSILVKPDGTTDFTKVSYVGELKYDSHINSYDLDAYIGETKYHITAEKMENFRKKHGVIWRVEGDHVYLIPKSGEVCGSELGFTLDEWNSGDTERGKILVKKKY